MSTPENSVSVRESETQPVVINLAANAVQPGQVKGLKRGLIGAKRGETREIMVKAEDGFGSSSVVSPLRVRVPAESELFYTVEVLRVSNTGVDDLFKGVSLCSVGVANKTTAGCSDLSDNKNDHQSRLYNFNAIFVRVLLWYSTSPSSASRLLRLYDPPPSAWSRTPP